MLFEEFAKKVIKYPEDKAPEVLLALDPGETIGYAVFYGLEHRETGQLVCESFDEAITKLTKLFVDVNPTHLVFEDYRIYKAKVKQHIGQELFTPQLIGVIKALCETKSIKPFKQMAQLAKQFCNDEKLRGWGLYAKSFRHGRDAVKHGAYYLLFSHNKTLQKE